MKITKILLIVLIISSLLITGCDINIKLLEDTPIEITVWHPFVGGKAEGVQFAADSYMELNPNITINTKFIAYDELLFTYQDAFVAEQAPDFFIGADDWGPELDLEEMLAPLTGINTDELNQASIATGIYQGYQIGIPYSLEGVVLYRNTAIQTAPAATYEELVEKAELATTENVYGALLETGSLYSLAHLNALGGSLMTNDGLPTFNSPEAVAWIDMLVKFTELGAESWYSDNDLIKFKTGEAGWIIGGTWNYNELSTALGENLAVDEWPGSMSGYVMADMIYLNPTSSTMQRKVAKEFIQYLVAKDSQTAASLFNADFVPVNMTVEPVNQHTKDIMNALAGGTSWIAKPEMDEYWGPIETIIRSVLEDGIDPLIALQMGLDIINDTIEIQTEPVP